MRTRAFTLVELLIVVMVLGVLAAIVVPQFSNAANDAKLSALTSDLQTVRGQLQLYKLQHNDMYPAQATFSEQLVGCTDASGATGTGSSYPYGPYLQTIPANPYTGANTVGSGAAGTSDWYHNATTGSFRANNTGYTTY